MNEINLSRVDLNLLVLFDAVLAERHVGRAAARLHLTSSAVSHGLGRLRRLLNDPLFLRTAKGMVPTERALSLASPVSDVLMRARSVLASAEPFEPARSNRRFVIGAPDSVSAVFLPGLIALVNNEAPAIDISVRQLLPAPGESSPEAMWGTAFSGLQARAMDLALIPIDTVRGQFHGQSLFDEEFVVAMRADHPCARLLTLDRFCNARHIVVSNTGDAHSFIDAALAAQGRSRRVALTVPNSMLALVVIAETDLICAMPRRFVGVHAARFRVVSVNAPLPLGRFNIKAVSTKPGLADSGLRWLLDAIARLDQLQSDRSARVSGSRPG